MAIKQNIDEIIKELHETKKGKRKSFTLTKSKSFILDRSQEMPTDKNPNPEKTAAVKIKLDFKIRKSPPHSVHIYVEDYGRGENGEVQLSPEIVGEKELDNYIDFLISELLQVRDEGKRKFRQTKK